MSSSEQSSARPLSGRRAQAVRNDPIILEAARRVFMDSPAAPISAVAKEAGVGISALYKRYASKEEMLARLCLDGLGEYVRIAEDALQIDDPEESFRSFMSGIVEADVHALTVRLAGRFTPSAEFEPLVSESARLNHRQLKRAKSAGVVRADIGVNDLVMIFEQLTAIRIASADRTRLLRRRYLMLHLDALRPGSEQKLPGPGPTDAELGERWQRRDDS